MANSVYLTPEGYQKYQSEQETLLTERVTVVEDVKKAREMGDLSENGFYKAAKGRLRFIDSRLLFLKSLLTQAIVVEEGGRTDVRFGSTVTFTDGVKEQTYQVVSRFEANPKEGKISVDSPIGKLLFGKKEGDRISFQSPKGEIIYTILQLR